MKLAVFLLAGRGSRLGPYGDHLPKCLIEVSGIPILHRMLGNLKKQGLKKAILVVGFLWKEIYKSIGDVWEGIEIEYVVNEDWEETNNIVSLYRAKNSILEDFLLLEGDIIVSESALGLFSGAKNQIAVSRFKPYMDGTVVTVDDRLVKKIYLKSDPNRPSEPGRLYKTVNIYCLEFNKFSSLILPELKKIIDSGATSVYYEQAFANLVNSSNMDFIPVDFSGIDWAEVDNKDDLQRAERIFP